MDGTQQARDGFPSCWMWSARSIPIAPGAFHVGRTPLSLCHPDVLVRLACGVGMGLLDKLFGSGPPKRSKDRPPKPDVDTYRDTLERTRYEATVHYRNGETETFECYGIYERGDARVRFNTDPYPTDSWGETPPSISYDRRSINYETLEREPTLEEIGTDTFELTADVSFEWRKPMMRPYAKLKWRPEYDDLELTVTRN